jgi:hypothetical protein
MDKIGGALLRQFVIVSLLVSAGLLACQGWGGSEAINEAGAYSEAQFSSEAERDRITGIADSVMTAKGFHPDRLRRSILENLASYEVRYDSDTGAKKASVYIEKNSYRVIQLLLQP